MRAWGHKTFENYVSANWLLALPRSEGILYITETINSVINENYSGDDSGSYPHSDISIEGLAAIETVAALLNKPCRSPTSTWPLEHWVKSHRM